jgi:hypothetical protein
MAQTLVDPTGRRCRQLGEHGTGLLRGVSEVVAARRDDEDHRRFLADGVPRGHTGVAAVVPEDGLAAGPLNHVRDPMPRSPRRVDPLQHEHPARIGVGAESADARQRQARLNCGIRARRLSTSRSARASTPAARPTFWMSIITSSSECGRATPLQPDSRAGRVLVDIAGRHGADLTQVLGKD